MDFVLGALFAAAFFVLLIIAYQFGQMNAAPKDLKSLMTEAEEDFELEEQREKAKRQRKAFDEMMAYNETKATKG